MTELPMGWPDNELTWCSACGVHYATPQKPLCVVCLDVAVRAEKAGPLDLTA